ncbi:MAG TPA: DNA repair protein RecO [Planctomycetota bacterium]|nr:DNA repair protein RecO [Planctomycetota bacterium]
MVLLRDEAIVLRRFEYGETSRIAHLLTRERGRISVLAKGAHREKSPFLGALDHLNRLGVVYSHRDDREMQILTEAEVQEGHRRLHRDLPRFAAALYAAELVLEAAREGEPATDLFDLFAEALEALASGQGQPGTIALAFELRFLAMIGLGPSFEGCRECGEPFPRVGMVALAPGAGGAVCGRCAPAHRTVGRFPVGTLRAAARLGGLRPSEARRVRLDPRMREGLREAMDLYLGYHFERAPRSRRWLSLGTDGA